ncbi:WD40 repeat-like protein [Sanghuangporus baumii]|uniref:WD40 repeat-like protein n=1 Tax=Sanghuangporus baumii TaxID=108892 RepID=A0A9Q5HRU7_SANBA|nr:WD40 repeat-like protein [Sanghuangporus baumii]
MTTVPPGASTNGTKPQTIALNDSIMTKLKPAKIFKGSVEPLPAPSPSQVPLRMQNPPPRQITGLTFDDRGDVLVTAAEDETFRLYNCKSGKHVKTLYSKKYGVDLPRFTHKNSSIIYASTKEDDTIRYHSLHDNKYLQYFKGHKERVVSLEVSPIDDGFMSGSLDRTVRLWDLRKPNCRGLLHLPSSPLVAYDNSGLVFAVAINTFCRILLYDMNNFDKEPFLTMTLEDPLLKLISFPPRQIYMTSLAFSSNGKYLLVGTSGNAHYILDAYEGHLLAKLEGHVGMERVRMEATVGLNPTKGISGEEVTWTPDSKFVISGSLDGKVCIWDVQNLPIRVNEPIDLNRNPMVLQPLATLDGHPGPSRCVRFNPRIAMMATAGSELAFWLPDLAGDGSDEVKEHFRKKLGG